MSSKANQPHQKPSPVLRDSPGSELQYNSVRIIVPVYKNLEVTRRCLESLARTPLPLNASVAIIIDASPEQALIDFCLSEGATRGYKVIVNQENQGFVRSANQGFALDKATDIVLLNSDTVVAGNWLERLQQCAYSTQTAGTATPFSNNGTICSYPLFPNESPMPEGWDVQALDGLFGRVNAGKNLAIPTAVGFCMYIKRRCLEETGEFDAENFGQGYGEECDFCLRATQLGWTHLLCADVFVFHKGGASFSHETKDRKHNADGIMARLHPTYDDLITRFIVEDPAQTLRDNITAARLNERPTDLNNVIGEQAAFRNALRQEIEKEQNRTGLVRAEVNDVQAEREKLEELLTLSRSEFAKTQKALDTAHEALDTLSGNFKNLQSEAGDLLQQVEALSIRLDETGSQLHASLEQNQALPARLEQMLTSRSWRYTRWLRNED